MPQIMKPTNTLCKHCQQRKQTKTRFKSKEYSTTRPLEIVHVDLVVPTTTKGLKGEKYLMLLVDYYTRMTVVLFLKNKSNFFMLLVDYYIIMTVVCFLKNKSKVFKKFKIYKEMVENKWIQKSNA
jgi:hypothetical protein